MSKEDLASVHSFLAKGGNVIADTMAGDCNIENRQYEKNPLAEMPQVKRVELLKTNVINPDWRYEVLPPDNGNVILDNLSRLPFCITAPESVLVRVNETEEEYIIHFINYTAKTCSGIKVETLSAKENFLYADFETAEWKTLPAGKEALLPDSISWSVLKFKK